MYIGLPLAFFNINLYILDTHVSLASAPTAQLSVQECLRPLSSIHVHPTVGIVSQIVRNIKEKEISQNSSISLTPAGDDGYDRNSIKSWTNICAVCCEVGLIFLKIGLEVFLKSLRISDVQSKVKKWCHIVGTVHSLDMVARSNCGITNGRLRKRGS